MAHWVRDSPSHQNRAYNHLGWQNSFASEKDVKCQQGRSGMCYYSTKKPQISSSRTRLPECGERVWLCSRTLCCRYTRQRPLTVSESVVTAVTRIVPWPRGIGMWMCDMSTSRSLIHSSSYTSDAVDRNYMYLRHVFKTIRFWSTLCVFPRKHTIVTTCTSSDCPTKCIDPRLTANKFDGVRQARQEPNPSDMRLKSIVR